MAQRPETADAFTVLPAEHENKALLQYTIDPTL